MMFYSMQFYIVDFYIISETNRKLPAFENSECDATFDLGWPQKSQEAHGLGALLDNKADMQWPQIKLGNIEIYVYVSL